MSQQRCTSFYSRSTVSVLRGHSVIFIPTTTANTAKWPLTLKDFYPRLHLLHLNSWERVSISLFECWVLNKGTIGIMSVLWRGPWRWNEPGTSRTRSNNSNIRRREDTVLHVYLLSIFLNTIMQLLVMYSIINQV